MPSRRRRSRIPTPAWEREHGAIGRQFAGRSPRFYSTAVVVLVALAAVGLVGYGFFSDWRADQQRPGSTALRVGENKYTVEYYAARLRTLVERVGGAVTQQGQITAALPSTTENLIGEAIVLGFAGELGQSASEDDIKNEIATQINLLVTDPTFETRYQAEILRSRLKEDDYREMIKAEVLRKKILAKFQVDLPISAESVHYRQIVVATQGEADDIRGQIDAGASFAELAKEKSLDTTTVDAGGDAGWAPRGLLDAELEELLFSLEPGALGAYELPNGGALVLEALEVAADRPVDDTLKPALAQRLFDDWLAEKRGTLEIVNNMDLQNGDGDKLTYAINYAYPNQ